MSRIRASRDWIGLNSMLDCSVLNIFCNTLSDIMVDIVAHHSVVFWSQKTHGSGTPPQLFDWRATQFCSYGIHWSLKQAFYIVPWLRRRARYTVSASSVLSSIWDKYFRHIFLRNYWGHPFDSWCAASCSY